MGRPLDRLLERGRWNIYRNLYQPFRLRTLSNRGLGETSGSNDFVHEPVPYEGKSLQEARRRDRNWAWSCYKNENERKEELEPEGRKKGIYNTSWTKVKECVGCWIFIDRRDRDRVDGKRDSTTTEICHKRFTNHIIVQLQPSVFSEYGSSFLPTGPHTDGTRWSFVVLQYRIRLALASLTLILGRVRSSLNRWLCSVRRRSFSSDMDCLCGRAFMMCMGF